MPRQNRPAFERTLPSHGKGWSLPLSRPFLCGRRKLSPATLLLPKTLPAVLQKRPRLSVATAHFPQLPVFKIPPRARLRAAVGRRQSSQSLPPRRRKRLNSGSRVPRRPLWKNTHGETRTARGCNTCQTTPSPPPSNQMPALPGGRAGSLGWGRSSGLPSPPASSGAGVGSGPGGRPRPRARSRRRTAGASRPHIASRLSQDPAPARGSLKVCGGAPLEDHRDPPQGTATFTPVSAGGSARVPASAAGAARQRPPTPTALHGLPRSWRRDPEAASVPRPASPWPRPASHAPSSPSRGRSTRAGAHLLPGPGAASLGAGWAVFRLLVFSYTSVTTCAIKLMANQLTANLQFQFLEISLPGERAPPLLIYK